MQITRALGMLVCVLPLWGGCVESEDELDPVETEAAAELTQTPICQDVVTTTVSLERCGPGPMFRKKITTCTTPYSLQITPAGVECVQDGLTYCHVTYGPCAPI